jgi:hypothetical protein
MENYQFNQPPNGYHHPNRIYPPQPPLGYLPPTNKPTNPSPPVTQDSFERKTTKKPTASPSEAQPVKPKKVPAQPKGISTGIALLGGLALLTTGSVVTYLVGNHFKWGKAADSASAKVTETVKEVVPKEIEAVLKQLGLKADATEKEILLALEKLGNDNNAFETANQQIEGLNKQVSDFETEVNNLKEQLTAAQNTNGDVSTLNVEIKKLEQKLRDAEQALQKAKNAHTIELQNQSDTHQQVIGEKAQQLADLQAEVERLQGSTPPVQENSLNRNPKEVDTTTEKRTSVVQGEEPINEPEEIPKIEPTQASDPPPEEIRKPKVSSVENYNYPDIPELVADYNQNPAEYTSGSSKGVMVSMDEASTAAIWGGRGNLSEFLPKIEKDSKGNYIRVCKQTTDDHALLVPKSNLNINDHNRGTLENLFVVDDQRSSDSHTIILEEPAILDSENQIVKMGKIKLVNK